MVDPVIDPWRPVVTQWTEYLFLWISVVINALSIAVRMNEESGASKSVSCMRVAKSSVRARWVVSKSSE